MEYSLFEVSSLVRKKRKTCTEFWSKNLHSIFSPFISALFIKLNIKPNFITFLMIPLSFASVFLSIYFFERPFLNLFLISFILSFITMIDVVDGEVARFTKQTSKYGKYLDRLCHYSLVASIFLSYGIYSLKLGNTTTATILFSILLIELFDITSKDNIHFLDGDKYTVTLSNRIKSKNKFINIFYSIIRIFFLDSAFPHIILVFFPIFAIYQFALLFYAIVYFIQLVIKVIYRSRKIATLYG